MIPNRPIAQVLSLFVLFGLLVIAAGCMSSNTPPSKQWFEGGNLHDATVAEWKSATYENRLATASDWLAATNWKGHLKSPDDFSRIKVKSEMLVKAIDEAAKVKKTDELQIKEIAAVIITMSNDLGP